MKFSLTMKIYIFIGNFCWLVIMRPYVFIVLYVDDIPFIIIIFSK